VGKKVPASAASVEVLATQYDTWLIAVTTFEPLTIPLKKGANSDKLLPQQNLQSLAACVADSAGM
jgi:hypothetical protein